MSFLQVEFERKYTSKNTVNSVMLVRKMSKSCSHPEFDKARRMTPSPTMMKRNPYTTLFFT